MKKFIVTVLTFFCQLNAWSGQFQQAYEAALLHDAAFQAARAELASVQQNVPLAQALLLPNVSISVSQAQVNGTRTADNNLGQPVDQTLDYRAPVQSFNIRAPLFNREGTKKLALAQAQVRYAESIFAARRVDLLERLALAYLQRLLSEQSVLLASAQLEAAQLQNELASRKLQLGEGTKPEWVEAGAMFEMAKVLARDAQNQRQLDELALLQITGANWVLPTTRANTPQATHLFTEQSDPLDSIAELLAKADAGNPTLAARRHAVELAQTAIARHGAGHYPRLDFVANATSTRNESISTLNQSVNQRSLGVQLNMPLYSGGYVNASVTQAMSDRDKADADLVVAKHTVTLEMTKAYFSAATGPAKILAYQTSMSSSKLALEAARKGLLTGFSTQADVALAQRRLAQTQRESVQAINDYLLARVRLALRAGAEPAEVAVDLDARLTSP